MFNDTIALIRQALAERKRRCLNPLASEVEGIYPEWTPERGKYYYESVEQEAELAISILSQF